MRRLLLDASGVERDPAEYLPSRGPSPEDHVLSGERRRQVLAALSQLPERQRLVFMLSHFEGRSSREVSAMTGLNESTVRVHLFRAIRRLRGLLGRRRPARRQRGEPAMRLVDVVLRQGHLSEQALVEAIMTGDRPAHLDRCDSCCAARALELEPLARERPNARRIDAAEDGFTARAARRAAGADSRGGSSSSTSRRASLRFQATARADPRDAGRRRVAPGWLGVAAAAGLVIGVIGGQRSASTATCRRWSSRCRRGPKPRDAAQASAANPWLEPRSDDDTSDVVEPLDA